MIKGEKPDYNAEGKDKPEKTPDNDPAIDKAFKDLDEAAKKLEEVI